MAIPGSGSRLYPDIRLEVGAVASLRGADGAASVPIDATELALLLGGGSMASTPRASDTVARRTVRRRRHSLPASIAARSARGRTTVNVAPWFTSDRT